MKHNISAINSVWSLEHAKRHQSLSLPPSREVSALIPLTFPQATAQSLPGVHLHLSLYSPSLFNSLVFGKVLEQSLVIVHPQQYLVSGRINMLLILLPKKPLKACKIYNHRETPKQE